MAEFGKFSLKLIFKTLQLLGTSSPDPLPGLRLWIPFPYFL